MIEFSLDGKSAEENNNIRVGSNYKKVSSLIKNLIELKHKLNIKKPQIFIANCQIPTEDEVKRGQPKLADYIIEDFSQYDDSEIKFKVCWTIYWLGMPSETSKYKLIESFEGMDTLNYCEHPIEIITIRYNGDVVACCYDTTSTYVLGNIKESSIKEIWNNERYRALRKSIKSKNYLPLCNNCNVLNPKIYFF